MAGLISQLLGSSLTTAGGLGTTGLMFTCFRSVNTPTSYWCDVAEHGRDA